MDLFEMYAFIQICVVYILVSVLLQVGKVFFCVNHRKCISESNKLKKNAKNHVGLALFFCFG
jgi:hypothetical protein